jgi:hypothetical protein
MLAGALVGAVAGIAGAPVARADTFPPGGLDETSSAILLLNGPTTDFQAGDQVLVAVSGWRDTPQQGPSVLRLVPWRDPLLRGQSGVEPPIPLVYSVSVWENPMTFALHVTLPSGVASGLYYVEVRGVTTATRTQIFFLTPTVASARQATGRWVPQVAPGGLADAGTLGVLATLSASVLLLGAVALQVAGIRRRWRT